jgi:hypothetical protein
VQDIGYMVNVMFALGVPAHPLLLALQTAFETDVEALAAGLDAAEAGAECAHSKVRGALTAL